MLPGSREIFLCSYAFSGDGDPEILTVYCWIVDVNISDQELTDRETNLSLAQK